ncbi:MAG TPA: 2OG-Fe(II) oxygenase [Pyrinomonadaceae bacterium]|jgi:SM-20-related protein|nr:2OG-Fe(II) oxygenase [Pyrinomonadaceae bacterium]
MNREELAASVELFLDGAFLDARECEALLAELRASGGSAAAVYGRGASGSVDERVRRTARLAPSRGAVEFVRRRLDGRIPALEGHFGVTLSGCEEPQFLRYDEGGFFVAHQDGGTGLIRSERELRKVSVVVFLNRQAETHEPGTYRGGSLVLHARLVSSEDERLPLACEPGTLAAFRAATTHEVLPVTGGERYTIACWFS